MYRSSIKLIAGSLVALFALLDVAFAHSVLSASSPSANSVLTQAPTEIRLSFNERVEPRFSSITIIGSDGKKVTSGRPAGDPQKPSDLVVALPPLSAGKYTVRWKATSADSHQIQGSFGFQIKP
jgi:methionine-rich copper-binding protein CopC